MKFIILLNTALVNLCFTSLAIAGCTNLSTSIDITNPDSFYTDNGDSTITDNNTGLMWQKCPLGLSGADCTIGTVLEINWLDALSNANTNSLSGYTDWRVPNKNELSSLVEYACSDPAINETFFPNTNATTFSPVYWSSTPSRSSPESVWYVEFKNGIAWSFHVDQPQNKDDLYIVRLVRGTVALDAAPTISQLPSVSKAKE